MGPQRFRPFTGSFTVQLTSQPEFPPVGGGGGVSTQIEYFEITNPLITDYELAQLPIVGKERVYLNGVFLRPGIGNDYTISGDTISLLVALEVNDLLGVVYEV